jgi:hypothetical protein
MLMEAQASIRVDTSLRAFALTWAILRLAPVKPDHKSVCAGSFLIHPSRKKAAGISGGF